MPAVSTLGTVGTKRTGYCVPSVAYYTTLTVARPHCLEGVRVGEDVGFHRAWAVLTVPTVLAARGHNTDRRLPLLMLHGWMPSWLQLDDDAWWGPTDAGGSRSPVTSDRTVL